ncbi:MAG TPA: class I adenylate-forming enzyme family protein [Terriglobales bacterium]|nr:class I adenylate-forming enzyme family protein [Terriglobales bacterium]
MMQTLGQFLDDACAQGGKREAIAYAPAERVVERMSWIELQQASRLAARRWLALGATKGVRVGLLCPNRSEWLPLAFGALRAGAVLVPLSTLWKRDEIAYALRHAEVELLVAVPSFLKHDYLAALAEILPGLASSGDEALPVPALPSLRRVLVLGASGSQIPSWNDAAIASDADLVAVERLVEATDLATIFFTSGTTAQAKAVMHPHHALVTSAHRLAACFGISAADAWWGHMPLFWSGGFVLGALATIAGGGRIVLHESVTAAGALQLLAEERCTIMAGWHQAAPLLDHPDFDRDRVFLRKGTFHALAPRLMGPDNCTIGVYGMSETATCVTAARWDDPEPIRTGTFGKPLAGMELRIVNPETRQPRRSGETGEILVRGETLMLGYVGVPPGETFDAQGFFATGDLGYFDDDGQLHFANRLKDVIKTAGVNVAAAEVEEALLRHPLVQAAHVVGVPDEARGENIAAFVVTSGGVDLDELRAFCRSMLASYKVPKMVFVVEEDQVPRTGTGKVEKVALRRLAMARAGTD